ncbi:MAG: hypothetical protein K2M06_00055 [Muribaculaceae bacterium]|nr:hypothetical protein [Muribaculaceae bacterium]
MKRFLIPVCVLGAMLLGACSEKESEIRNEPEVPAESEIPSGPAVKAYEDVTPLELMDHWALSSGEKKSLASLADFAYRLNGAAIDSYNDVWTGDMTGNYSLSPMSVSVMLAALSESVDGQNRENLCGMLGVAVDEVGELNNKLLRYLMKDFPGMQISLANSVWHVKGMPMTDEYKARMADLFGAPVNELDLYSDDAAVVLNGWCGDKTKGMIDNVFSNAPGVDFLLANALYFSSEWVFPFKESETTPAEFKGMGGMAEVDMMHNSSLIGTHADVDGVEFIRLPFGFGYEMDIIMPAQGTDMNVFGKALSPGVISKYDAASAEKRIDFRLPKFKDEHQGDFKNLLHALGMPGYEMSAQASTGSESYTIKNVFAKHATALNVNEKGAELAAITTSGWAHSPGFVPDYENVEMTVDRPFYYVIRNTDCDVVLLIGRVCNL